MKTAVLHLDTSTTEHLCRPFPNYGVFIKKKKTPQHKDLVHELVSELGRSFPDFYQGIIFYFNPDLFLCHNSGE